MTSILVGSSNILELVKYKQKSVKHFEVVETMVCLKVLLIMPLIIIMIWFINHPQSSHCRKLQAYMLPETYL